MRGGAIGSDGEANVEAPHARALPTSGDDIQTSSSVGGRIGPAPSSRFAAAALRFAPSGDGAAPIRRSASMVFAERSRPTRPTSRSKDHENRQPEPRARVEACDLRTSIRGATRAGGRGHRASERTPVFRRAVDAEHEAPGGIAALRAGFDPKLTLRWQAPSDRGWPKAERRVAAIEALGRVFSPAARRHRSHPPTYGATGCVHSNGKTKRKGRGR